ncbi:MAG TPA: DUF58 domain-containing protein, partial [Thermodesulfobacteriota bacterium]|nr:DUF58 domain-containing protein [Thermodesulfobacteriota bacterium]
MIVPTGRLLTFYSVAIPPLMLLPILEEAAALPALGVGLMLILIALVDAAYASARLRDIGVSLPKAARMIRDREGSLEINLSKTRAQARTFRVGLPFPREISSSREDLLATLPGSARSACLLWPCTPLKRGRFHIKTCYVEVESPLRLWTFRDSRDATCEIRVYPNLTMERNSLSALFLNRGGYGVHPRRQYGKGKEFEKLREYIPGDGFDEIHWKATAKRRHPITKIFQIERTQEVYVILDTSRLSARPAVPMDGRGNDSSLERFIAAALVLGLAAQKQGDLFGMLTFSDSVHAFLRARGGKAHYGACREQLFSIQPRMVNPDYEELSIFVDLKLRRRALIILLTSLDDPVLAESFVRT